MSTEDKDYGQLVTLVSDMIYHLIRKRLLIEAYVQLDLMLYIKQLVSIDVFKKNLITHYFRQFYDLF